MRQRKPKAQSFFYFTKLNNWDRVTIISYLVISLLLWLYFDDIEGEGNQAGTLLMYGFSTQMLLYSINYRSLRNGYVYLFWILIGLMHLIIFFRLSLDPTLQMANGHAATILRNTIILLLLFQLLRFISLKMQAKELVAVNRGPTDFFNERRITYIDKISTFAYIISAILLPLID